MVISRKFKLHFFILIQISLLLLSPIVQAAPLAKIEVLSGFGIGKLLQQGTYHIIPVFVDFDFNLKNWTQAHNFNPPGLLEGVIEPFASYVIDPDSNVEAG